jgi:hypothetical protein
MTRSGVSSIRRFRAALSLSELEKRLYMPGRSMISTSCPSTFKTPLFTSTADPGYLQTRILWLINRLKIVLLPTFGNPISKTLLNAYPFIR